MNKPIGSNGWFGEFLAVFVSAVSWFDKVGFTARLEESG